MNENAQQSLTKMVQEYEQRILFATELKKLLLTFNFDEFYFAEDTFTFVSSNLTLAQLTPYRRALLKYVNAPITLDHITPDEKGTFYIVYKCSYLNLQLCNITRDELENFGLIKPSCKIEETTMTYRTLVCGV